MRNVSIIRIYQQQLPYNHGDGQPDNGLEYMQILLDRYKESASNSRRCQRWIEAHPMTTITSTATAQICRKLFATFGVPEVPGHRQWSQFCKCCSLMQFLKNSIRHKTSPPYHPATNGLAERAVQTVKRV